MTPTTTPSDSAPADLSALTGPAETAEAAFMHAYEADAPAEVRAALGITTARIGGGVALAMRKDPIGFWTRALGFGISEPVTAELLDEIVEFYRASGVASAVVQIAPSLLPPDWDEISAARGIEPGSPGALWVKLGAAIEDLHPKASTELRVGPVEPSDAEEWAAAILRGYGAPLDDIALMLAAGVRHPDFRPYAAWDGDEIVAGASLLVHGSVASLNTAATVPGHRGKGAQTALIAARVEAARREGCRWVTAETGLPAEGQRNPSLDNLESAGLHRLYLRPNWIWRATDADGTGR